MFILYHEDDIDVWHIFLPTKVEKSRIFKNGLKVKNIIGCY